VSPVRFRSAPLPVAERSRTALCPSPALALVNVRQPLLLPAQPRRRGRQQRHELVSQLRARRGEPHESHRVPASSATSQALRRRVGDLGDRLPGHPGPEGPRRAPPFVISGLRYSRADKIAANRLLYGARPSHEALVLFRLRPGARARRDRRRHVGSRRPTLGLDGFARPLSMYRSLRFRGRFAPAHQWGLACFRYGSPLRRSTTRVARCAFDLSGASRQAHTPRRRARTHSHTSKAATTPLGAPKPTKWRVVFLGPALARTLLLMDRGQIGKSRTGSGTMREAISVSLPCRGLASLPGLATSLEQRLADGVRAPRARAILLGLLPDPRRATLMRPTSAWLCQLLTGGHSTCVYDGRSSGLRAWAWSAWFARSRRPAAVPRDLAFLGIPEVAVEDARLLSRPVAGDGGPTVSPSVLLRTLRYCAPPASTPRRSRRAIEDSPDPTGRWPLWPALYATTRKPARGVFLDRGRAGGRRPGGR